jgi:hypothetical protein
MNDFEGHPTMDALAEAKHHIELSQYEGWDNMPILLAKLEYAKAYAAIAQAEALDRIANRGGDIALHLVGILTLLEGIESRHEKALTAQAEALESIALSLDIIVQDVVWSKGK